MEGGGGEYYHAVEHERPRDSRDDSIPHPRPAVTVPFGGLEVCIALASRCTIEEGPRMPDNQAMPRCVDV